MNQAQGLHRGLEAYQDMRNGVIGRGEGLQAAASPQRLPEVQQVLNSLSSNLEHLENAVSRLFGRLAPVMGPPPVPPGEKSISPGYSSQHAAMLQGAIDHLRAQTERLIALEQSLEI